MNIVWLLLFSGIGDKELTRFEMATILCFGDKPYSQIMDSMPERSGITGQKELFEPTLSEVSVSKGPRGFLRGIRFGNNKWNSMCLM